ncbi:hypothetical protein AWB78_07165 [Caballeronia calidae]|uniref:Uncharacterized protein n=1 Tax=Caballeronia calidae TaxID=1777139 RepID=A0A158EDA4_9BURK|nr:hypothetical protein [Caballeronia calidae]SAL04855.1 hypothetical protein AWB78_07165 [Caballeronia calidae]
MGAPLVTSATTVMCGHAGSATHTPSQTRVLVGGSPVAVTSDQHMIGGCSLSGSSGPFCTVLAWTMPAMRVTAVGASVLIQSSMPMGVGPGMVVSGQTRVSAT